MQYDFNIAANGGQPIEVAGRFFKYKAGTGAIRVTTSKGGYIDLIPGQGVWGDEFTRLVVKDISGAPNAGILLAGNYDFRDSAIPGIVNTAATGTTLVEPFGRTNSLAGKTFMGGARMPTTPTGGDLNTVYLANPAGSPKKLILTNLVCVSDGQFVEALHAAFTDTHPFNMSMGKNGAIGANYGVSSGQILTAAVVAALGGKSFDIGINAGAQQINLPFDDPIILLPGHAFLLTANTSGATISAMFQWREE